MTNQKHTYMMHKTLDVAVSMKIWESDILI